MKLTRKRIGETRGRKSIYLPRIEEAWEKRRAIECESETEWRGVQECARRAGYRTRRRANVVEIIGKRKR
jgi:hypothetical protein